MPSRRSPCHGVPLRLCLKEHTTNSFIFDDVIVFKHSGRMLQRMGWRNDALTQKIFQKRMNNETCNPLIRLHEIEATYLYNRGELVLHTDLRIGAEVTPFANHCVTALLSSSISGSIHESISSPNYNLCATYYAYRELKRAGFSISDIQIGRHSKASSTMVSTMRFRRTTRGIKDERTEWTEKFDENIWTKSLSRPTQKIGCCVTVFPDTTQFSISKLGLENKKRLIFIVAVVDLNVLRDPTVVFLKETCPFASHSSPLHALANPRLANPRGIENPLK